MPWVWKIAMGVLFACLLASMVIGVVKLSTTEIQTFKPGLTGWGQMTPAALREG